MFYTKLSLYNGALKIEGSKPVVVEEPKWSGNKDTSNVMGDVKWYSCGDALGWSIPYPDYVIDIMDNINAHQYIRGCSQQNL